MEGPAPKEVSVEEPVTLRCVLIFINANLNRFREEC